MARSAPDLDYPTAPGGAFLGVDFDPDVLANKLGEIPVNLWDVETPELQDQLRRPVDSADRDLAIARACHVLAMSALWQVASAPPKNGQSPIGSTVSSFPPRPNTAELERTIDEIMIDLRGDNPDPSRAGDLAIALAWQRGESPTLTPINAPISPVGISATDLRGWVAGAFADLTGFRPPSPRGALD